MKLNRSQIDIALVNAGLSSYLQLSRRVGCSPQNLSVILNRGSCKPDTANKIAAALGVPLENIVTKE